MNKKLKGRYFVLAPSFQGATLLAKLLNSHPDVVSLGDTYPTNTFDQICGCKEMISECEFWQLVKQRTEASKFNDCSEMLPRYPKIVNKSVDKVLYNFLPPAVISKLLDDSNKNEFIEHYNEFESCILERSKENGVRSTVNVDGIKSISRVKSFIAMGEQVDGIIHLRRDPKDYVWSALKHDQSKRNFMNLSKKSIGWRMFHRSTESLKKHVPYLSLDYSDLVDNSEQTLERLFKFINVENKSYDQLAKNFDQTWHFIGNSSLQKFDGILKKSTHETNAVEEKIIDFFSGVKTSNS